jgi:acyl dehydratase
LPTHAQLALIYRLSGDLNPLHCDPAVARKANYPQPILHGLATYGIAGHALMKGLCDYDPARFRAIEARFSAPVFPGEAIATEIWREAAGEAEFRCRVAAREATVIANGRFVYDA